MCWVYVCVCVKSIDARMVGSHAPQNQKLKIQLNVIQLYISSFVFFFYFNFMFFLFVEFFFTETVMCIFWMSFSRSLIGAGLHLTDTLHSSCVCLFFGYSCVAYVKFICILFKIASRK